MSWGGGFLYALTIFILCNGLGNFFEYRAVDRSEISANFDRMPRQLVYQYYIDGKSYVGDQNISPSDAENVKIDSLVILYNTSFKSISLVDGLSSDSSKTDDMSFIMKLCAGFVLFFFLLYRFGNIAKWVKVYTGR